MLPVNWQPGQSQLDLGMEQEYFTEVASLATSHPKTCDVIYCPTVWRWLELDTAHLGHLFSSSTVTFRSISLVASDARGQGWPVPWGLAIHYFLTGRVLWHLFTLFLLRRELLPLVVLKESSLKKRLISAWFFLISPMANILVRVFYRNRASKKL